MPKDASDTTQRRRQRVLFADRVVQDTTFNNKGKNYIILEGNINHKAPMAYSPSYYGMINGAVETTPEELESYIASVPGSETVPDAPTNVAAVAGDQAAVITFTAPANDGGNAIMSYTVTSNPGGLTATGSGSPITITGLTNGTTYTFTVVATNGVGNSSPSSASNSVTPATTPDAPTNVVAVAGNQQATITFSAPVNNGGSPVTSYTVTSNPGGITATASSSPITVTGLTNGTAYTFTVIATNGVGDSPSSSASDPVTPASPPDAPTSLVGIPGDTEVQIQFTSGADGGSAITNYKYSTDDGVTYTALSPPDATSPIRITGLTNNTAYTIRLKAVNSIGDSIASDAVSVTPVVTIVVQFTSVGSTTWIAPAGVSSISYFIVGGGGGGGGSYDTGAGGGGGGGLVLSGSRSVTPGQSYTVVVGAGGAGGIGVGGGGGDGLATPGGDSSFDTIVASGGGIGYGSLDDRGGAGGAQGTAGTLTSPTGGKGGRTTGSINNQYGGGGGGGMSSAGATAVSTTNAAGGTGIFSNITGITVEYGKGGSGGRVAVNANGTSAAANTGNGGNGSGSTSFDGSTGGAGGSGIVVILYATPVISGSPRVLLLGDSNAANLPTELNFAKTDLGYSGTMTFTTKNIFGSDSGYTGSDITTDNFDVVVLYTNSGSTPSSSLGTNLNSYVASGGNLIMAVFAWGNVPAIQNLDYSANSTYVYAGTQSFESGVITEVVSHPIFTGIDNSVAISASATPSIALTLGATGIGAFSDTNWFIAVKESGSSKLVGINGYFAYMTWNGGSSYQNMLQYVVNSIYWCIGSLA